MQSVRVGVWAPGRGVHTLTEEKIKCLLGSGAEQVTTRYCTLHSGGFINNKQKRAFED